MDGDGLLLSDEMLSWAPSWGGSSIFLQESQEERHNQVTPLFFSPPHSFPSSEALVAAGIVTGRLLDLVAPRRERKVLFKGIPVDWLRMEALHGLGCFAGLVGALVCAVKDISV